MDGGGKRSPVTKRPSTARLAVEELEPIIAPTVTVPMMGTSYNFLHDHSLTATANGSNGIYGVLQNVTTDTSNALTVTEVNGSSANVGTAITLFNGSSLTLSADGSFYIVPVSASAYMDTCTVKISDVASDASMGVTFNITNTAPSISSVSFNTSSPQTNDTLTTTVSAGDVDSDTLSYYYEWKVNGNTVRTNTTTSTTDSLDLSQTGNGNRGDSIILSVTASDGVSTTFPGYANTTIVNSLPAASNQSLSVLYDDVLTGINLASYVADADGDSFSISIVSGPAYGDFDQNGSTYDYTPPENWTGIITIDFRGADSYGYGNTATLTIHVTHTAEELYATYLAAVEDANADYLIAVADRDAAIASARAAAQADADAFYANYEAAVAAAQATYDAAIADAEAAYVGALLDANAAWDAATADAQEDYDTALASAEASYDDAIAQANDDCGTAIAAADTAYDGTVLPYQSARDSAYSAWQADLENTELEAAYNLAQQDLDDAIDSATSQRDADCAAALTAWQAGIDSAEADLAVAKQTAQDDYDAAIEPANDDWVNAEGAAWAIYSAAKQDAEDTFADEEASAWTEYLAGAEDIDANVAATEAAIESQYETAVSAAVSTWVSEESAAWSTYETAMTVVPGAPQLDERIRAPPAIGEFTGCDLGERLPPEFVAQQQQQETPLQALNRIFGEINTEFARLTGIRAQITADLQILGGFRTAMQNNPGQFGAILDDYTARFGIMLARMADVRARANAIITKATQAARGSQGENFRVIGIQGRLADLDIQLRGIAGQLTSERASLDATALLEAAVQDVTAIRTRQSELTTWINDLVSWFSLIWKNRSVELASQG